MNSNTIFYENGEINRNERAHTLRLRRLELCSCWFRGHLPSRVYIMWPGILFPGASSFTMRIGRAMIGFRWYDTSAALAGKETKP